MENIVNIIPKPNDIKLMDGYCEISPSDNIYYTTKAKYAGEFLCEFTGLKKAKSGRIKLTISSAIENEEGYILEIKPEGIKITGRNDRGIFYGVQSLRQLMDADVEQNKISDTIKFLCLKIVDEPRFKYRGHMLDVARHFFGVKTIKRQLDMMAFHKLNKFHWHLSDDQGFRIEIEKYPLLTKVGSKREKTLVKGFMLPWGKKYDNTMHEGYYTKEDIKEIVNYAKKLHIDIIPEIDMPGHMIAALAAYPEYSCRGKDIKVACEPMISKDALCVGKEEAIEFAVDILLEVGKMFPYKHMHIGGDEVAKGSWDKCEDCKKLMKEKDLKDTHKLQKYFTNIIVKRLKDAGYTVIGWDEVLGENMYTDIINEYWSPKGRDKSIEYLNKGVKTIFAPFSKYYLDYTFRLIPLKQSYEYDPFDEKILKEYADCVIGVEAPLWTEFVDSEQRIDWQTYPLLTSMSETAWTMDYEKNFIDFLARLKAMEERYKALGINHCIEKVYSYDKKPIYYSMMFMKDHIANLEYYKYHEDDRNIDK